VAESNWRGDGMTIKSIEDRVIRIESKLTRAMRGLGMDAEGNPLVGTVLIDEDTTNAILDALDGYMNLMDKHDGVTFVERPEYNTTEALYNKLLDLRNARWKNN
jgi:hypothetical protein